MAEFEYQNVEAWNTAVKLAASIGRLKIGSNLKASIDAQSHAFEQAGLACALIAEASGREGPAQGDLYREARGALAQCRSWIHILAAVTNEQDTVFAHELELAEHAARQVSAYLRVGAGRLPGGPARGPAPGGSRPPAPGNPRPPARNQGGGPR